MASSPAGTAPGRTVYADFVYLITFLLYFASHYSIVQKQRLKMVKSVSKLAKFVVFILGHL